MPCEDHKAYVTCLQIAGGAVLNPEKQAAASSQAHKVKQFFPYAHVRSWENHGNFVVTWAPAILR